MPNFAAMNTPSANKKRQQLPPFNRQEEHIRAFAEKVLDILPYDPTEDQMLAIAAIAHFITYDATTPVFVLGGYAGTGKSSLVGGIVRTMTSMAMKCVLMAPTGRAAHVFGEYAGHAALTIHRKIYRQQSYGSDTYALAENKHTDTLFLVDEASMIANGASDGQQFGTGRLLDDLIEYVYSGKGCRLMLIGDVAQLPPVGSDDSPALNGEVLRGYGLTPFVMQLRQTVRQAEDSGILQNATMLRDMMEANTLQAPQLALEGFGDMKSVSGEYLLEELSDCYDRDGLDETIIITRSNRRAGLYNAGVRNSILFREDELAGGDLLIVAKNNYFWAEEYDQLDFIANGDVLRVKRVRGDVEHLYGLRFINATVVLPDHDDVEMEVKVALDSLRSESAALTREQNEQLLARVWEELEGDKRTRFRALKKHHYFNALQVKYGYAVTCHKAQGGQWKNVFIDMGGIMPEATTTLDYFRWLYTALTRAREKVYLINYRQAEED